MHRGTGDEIQEQIYDVTNGKRHWETWSKSLDDIAKNTPGNGFGKRTGLCITQYKESHIPPGAVQKKQREYSSEIEHESPKRKHDTVLCAWLDNSLHFSCQFWGSIL